MHIGIMGLGYVGLPLAVAFAEEGHSVVALDTDARKIEALRERRSYVEDISDERLAAVSDRIQPTRHPRPLPRPVGAAPPPAAAGALRGGPDLRPDAADGQPRAGPRPARVGHA